MKTTTASARTGRPKSLAKREAILEASAHLFLQQGFKDTSVDAVAAAAGVSKQTVYSHFRGKDALLRACVESKMDEHGLRVDHLPMDGPIDAALKHFGRQFAALLNDEQVICMYRLLISEAVAHPKVSQTFFDAGPKATRRALARFLEQHPEGGSRFHESARAAEMFFSLLEHVHVMERLLNLRGPMSPDERRDHSDRMVDQFLAMHPA
ncbi:MAG: TetR/AcrR family transcriptional regulator [Pseudomonadota bacterium]